MFDNGWLTHRNRPQFREVFQFNELTDSETTDPIIKGTKNKI